MAADDVAVVDSETYLVDVRTGEQLPATVENAARVLAAAREMKQRLNGVVADATDWLVAESRRQGTKTLRDGAAEITVSGGETVDYDTVRLREELAAAGCPDYRIDDAIVATVEYKINRSVLRQLAASNPYYRRAIAAAEVAVEKPYRAAVK